jgi:hypothetical protein
VDFTPPGVAGLSAVGFLFSGGGVEGDLVSSGIARESSDLAPFGKNVHFYQLERVVSTRPGAYRQKITSSNTAWGTALQHRLSERSTGREANDGN